MPLDLPNGTTLFVDANILAYAVVEHQEFTPPCRDLLHRIELGRIAASTASFAIADALHKIMLAETRLRLSELVNVGRHLQNHPETVKSLVFARQSAQFFAGLPLELLPLDKSSLVEAMEISGRYGLLTNDSRILTLMQRHGISHLATNDDDFDQVPGITVWKPRAPT